MFKLPHKIKFDVSGGVVSYICKSLTFLLEVMFSITLDVFKAGSGRKHHFDVLCDNLNIGVAPIPVLSSVLNLANLYITPLVLTM